MYCYVLEYVVNNIEYDIVKVLATIKYNFYYFNHKKVKKMRVLSL